jgi:hypothetical protein
MYRGDNVRRHWLGISVVIIVCALVIAFLAIRYIKPNPAYLFRRRFGFDLPKSAVVLNYTYMSIFDDAPQSFRREPHMFIKFAFPDSAYDQIMQGLDAYFSIDRHKYRYEKDEINEATAKYFVRGYPEFVSWWDVNEDDIVLAYDRMDSGKIVKTIYVRAVITQDASGKYYLYAAD